MASPDREGRPLHPQLTPAQRAGLLARGVELFNSGAYFAAHEAWEEIWRSTTPEPRELFQGLVQVAAGFHHLTARRRPDVARRVLAKARRRLAAVRPEEDCGIGLNSLLAGLAAWEDHLASAPDAPRPSPQIEFAPPRP